jgi:hypothetical protein
VFRFNSTGIRFSTVSNFPKDFAAVEAEIDDLAGGITAVA